MKERKIMTRLCYIFILVFCAICHVQAQTTTIIKPGDSFNQLINNANPGDIFLFNPGTCENLSIRDVNGTETEPIVLKSNDLSGIVDFKGDYKTDELWWSGNRMGGEIRNCSYVAFDNLHFSDGSEGVHVFESDHLIFLNCEITNTGQVGIKFSKRTAKNNSSTDYSHHIDWIGGRVSNTGNSQGGAYGEAFYIGQAQQNIDKTNHIWIEGVEVWDTNGGEAFDIKPEVTDITIRNNHIHDIEVYAVGGVSGKVAQVNSGAIQVVAGGELSNANDKTTDPHRLWIENNTIERVFAENGNTNPDRGNGISIIGRPNVHLKNNIIRDVEHNGIYGFLYEGLDPGYQTLVDEFTVNNTKGGSGYDDISVSSGSLQLAVDVGNNPMSRQTWYGFDGGGDDITDAVLSVEAPDFVTPGSTVAITASYSSSIDGDIVVNFQLDEHPWDRFEDVRSDIVRGNNQTITLEMVIPSDVPIADGAYQFQVYITENDRGWGDVLANRAKANVTCIADQIPDGQWIVIRSSNRENKLSACNSITEPMTAIGSVMGDEDIYYSQLNADGSYSFKNKLTNKWLQTQANGRLLAKKASVSGSWEKFEWINNSDGTFSLKAKRNNRIISAKSENSWQLVAEGQLIGPEDKYTWETVSSSLVSRKAGLAVEEISIEEQPLFSVYPNPASNRIIVNTSENCNYSLLDQSGKVVRSGELTESNTEINISGVQSGIYILTFLSEEERINRKIIID